MNTAWIWIVITATGLMSACSHDSQRENKAVKPFSDFDLLTVAQSPCLFDCPVFELNIHGDGRIRHSGPAFDNTGGPVESRTDRDGLMQLANALRSARIDEMRDRYQTEEDGYAHHMSDMPTLHFMVIRGQGNRIKRVTLDVGCMGLDVPTERIKTLTEAIDLVAGTGALLEKRKRVVESDKTSS